MTEENKKNNSKKDSSRDFKLSNPIKNIQDLKNESKELKYLIKHFEEFNLDKPELEDYVVKVLDSNASILTKNILIEGDIDKNLVDVVNDSKLLSNFLKKFEQYSLFFRDKLDLQYGFRISTTKEWGESLEQLGVVLTADNEINFKKEGYVSNVAHKQFLVNLRDDIISNPETLDSDYYGLFNELIRKSHNKERIEDRALHSLYYLGVDFDSKYSLEKITDLLLGYKDHEILKKFGQSDVAYSPPVLDQVFRKIIKYIKQGDCNSINDCIECASINISNYQLISKIAEGTSKRVYKAIYQKPGFDPITVALKIVNRTDLPDSSNVDNLIQRFGLEDITKGEINAMLKTKNPSVASIYDFGKTNKGKLYIAEEFVEGVSLRDVINQRPVLESVFNNLFSMSISDEELDSGRIDLSDLLPDSFNSIEEEKLVVSAKEKNCSRSELKDKLLTKKQNLYSQRALSNTRFSSKFTFSKEKSIMRYVVKDGIVSEEDYLTKIPEDLARLSFYFSLFEKILKSVYKLHEDNLVHLDIKPENIIIGDVVKLTDFQTAGILEDFYVSGAKGVHGSKQYAGPELFWDSSPGIHSDIYSLGIIFYELLTGELPFGPYDSREKAKKDHELNHEDNLEKALDKLNFYKSDEVKFLFEKVLTDDSTSRYDLMSTFISHFNMVQNSLFQDFRVDVEGIPVFDEDLITLFELRRKYGFDDLNKILKYTKHLDMTDHVPLHEPSGGVDYGDWDDEE